MTRRLLVVGLDGYEPTVGQALMDEGRLPNLTRLEATARTQALDHGEDRFTGLAWEQFAADEAGAHARAGAVAFDAETYTVRQPTSRRVPFTRGLGRDVVALDLPYYDLSASDARGFAPWGAHDPGVPATSVPAGLDIEIAERFGPYPATPWIYGFVWPDADATRRMGDGLAAAVRLRTELTRWLFQERLPGWELGMTVVSELHSASEALWHGWDETHPLHAHPSGAAAREGLLAIYEAVDDLVGDLMETFADVEQLYFAPHGMGVNHADVPAMLLLPELLYRHETGRRAFVAPDTWCADGTVPSGWPEGADWSQAVWPHFREVRARRRFSWRRSGKRPASAPHLGWMPTARYAPAWPEMRAFATPAFYDGRVRVNLWGRESRGRVRPADRCAVLDEIEQLIRETTDLATGRPLDVQVLRPELGDPTALAPEAADLVVRFEGPTFGWSHPDHGTIGPAPWRRTGGHTGDFGRAWWHLQRDRAGFAGTVPTETVVPALREVLGEAEILPTA